MTERYPIEPEQEPHETVGRQSAEAGGEDGEMSFVDEPTESVQLPPAPDISQLPGPVREIAERRVESLTRSIVDPKVRAVVRDAVYGNTFYRYRAAQLVRRITASRT